MNPENIRAEFERAQKALRAAQLLHADALFEDAVQDIPEIVECYTVSGDRDFLLRVVVKDGKPVKCESVVEGFVFSNAVAAHDDPPVDASRAGATTCLDRAWRTAHSDAMR